MIVLIDYTNWKGVRAPRRIKPKSIRFGTSDYHPEPGWLLTATDTVTMSDREFAMKDIHSWKEIRNAES